MIMPGIQKQDDSAAEKYENVFLEKRVSEATRCKREAQVDQSIQMGEESTVKEGDKSEKTGRISPKNLSQTEEQIIFSEYLSIGSRWTHIAKILNGRTQNCVKNKFYGGLRKMLRKLNEKGKENLKKFSKPIKYEAITRILESRDGMYNLNEKLINDAVRIRKQIIEFCQFPEQLDVIENVSSCIESIHKFNLESRCYKRRKHAKVEKNLDKSRKQDHENKDFSTKIQQRHKEGMHPKESSSNDEISLLSQIQDSLQNIMPQRRTKENQIQKLSFPEEIDHQSQINAYFTFGAEDNFDLELSRILGIDFMPSSSKYYPFHS